MVRKASPKASLLEEKYWRDHRAASLYEEQHRFQLRFHAEEQRREMSSWTPETRYDFKAVIDELTAYTAEQHWRNEFDEFHSRKRSLK